MLQSRMLFIQMLMHRRMRLSQQFGRTVTATTASMAKCDAASDCLGDAIRKATFIAFRNTTGDRSRAQKRVCDTSAFRTGIGYRAMDVSDPSTAANATDCCNQCATYRFGCKHFTFSSGSRQCWLKWGHGVDKKVADATSGPAITWAWP